MRSTLALTGRGPAGARSREPTKASPDAVTVALTGRGPAGARSREPTKASPDAVTVALTGVFLLLSIAAPARADDTHYQDYPLGGRAVGLGGAFTALADDPSGVFYNPAGLVDQERHSIQVSTNLYGLEVADSFFNAVGRVTDLDTVFSELNVIPSAASFSGVLRKDENGVPLTSYGLGVFVPSSRVLNVQVFSEVANGDTECTTVTYNRSLSDRTFLLGLAGSQRLNDEWSSGVSLFLAYRALRETEDVACSAGPNRFSTASTNINLAIAAIRASFGIKVKLGGRWRLGAALLTPSVRMYDIATVSVRRGSALSETQPPEFFARELTQLNADTKFSPQLRLGAAYIWPDTLTVTLDLNLHAGTEYDLYDLPADEDAVGDAITTVRRVVRRPVINVNAGIEYEFWSRFSVAAGAFSNFSSARPIDGPVGSTFSRDRLAQVHAAGGSLVLGFKTEYTYTRIGGTMSYGEGTDVVPRTPGLAILGQPDEFVKVGFSQLFAFAYISSTFQY